MSDWLKEWYKKKFLEMEVKPSPKSWDKIFMHLREWPSHWYQTNAKKVVLTPKPNMWESINEQIVRNSSSQIKNYYKWAYTFTFFIAFIPFSIKNDSLAIFDNKLDLQVISDKVKFTQNHNEGIVDTKKMSSTNEPYKISQKNKPLPKTSIITERNDSMNGNNTTIPDLNNALSEYTVYHSNTDQNLEKIELLEPSKIDQKINIIKEHVLASVDPIYTLNKEWSMTGFIRPQFSTLINPLSTLSFQDNDIINNPGKSITFGVELGRKISEKGSLLMAVEINNIKSQNTKHLDNLSEKVIQLNYSSLTFNYQHEYNIFKKSKINLLTGAFVSYLNNTEHAENEPVFDLRNGFKKYDLGLSLGAEYMCSMNENFNFVAGINQQWGISNIFKGTSDIPSAFFETKTQSLGLKLGIRKYF